MSSLEDASRDLHFSAIATEDTSDIRKILGDFDKASQSVSDGIKLMRSCVKRTHALLVAPRVVARRIERQESFSSTVSGLPEGEVGTAPSQS